MKYYQITDAAKKVNVESHVLRYWEEELDLPIERNKQGHRLYTEEDLQRFLYIKELKKEGLQLRAIRAKVHKAEDWAKKVQDEQQYKEEEKETEESQEEEEQNTLEGRNKTGEERKTLEGRNKTEEEPEKDRQTERIRRSDEPVKRNALQEVRREYRKEVYSSESDDREEKAAKLCMMLQQLVGQAVRNENREMISELKKSVAETVSKEMNYQFRMQEQRDEEHYQRIDELLREKSGRKRLFQTKQTEEQENGSEKGTERDKRRGKKKKTKAELDKEMLLEKKRKEEQMLEK